MATTRVYTVQAPSPPRLPTPTLEYDIQYQTQLLNVLRLYFNRLTTILGEIGVAGDTGIYPAGTAGDAFGRMRSSAPYTLFQSQSRYAPAEGYVSDLNSTHPTPELYNADESSIDLNVNLPNGEYVTRQSARVFPYQPGKSLLVMSTFAMSPFLENNLQQVGYFNDDNGVFFERDNTGVLNFVLRSNSAPTPGTVTNTRVSQSNWNGDKLDGTGASGVTLDPTKAQIFFADFEWLGVGQVRCGFVLNGKLIVCHSFFNANSLATTYMTTAILPVRAHIENTSAVPAGPNTPFLKTICNTVISEGGFSEISKDYFASEDTVTAITAGGAGTPGNYIPLAAIRLPAARNGAVILPKEMTFFPTTNQLYEVVLCKLDDDGVYLNTTPANSWTTHPGTANVQFATNSNNGLVFTVQPPAQSIVQRSYVSSTAQSRTALSTQTDYNWDLQLGYDPFINRSQLLVLAVRTVDGATNGNGVGSLSFYDLTQ